MLVYTTLAELVPRQQRPVHRQRSHSKKGSQLPCDKAAMASQLEATPVVSVVAVPPPLAGQPSVRSLVGSDERGGVEWMSAADIVKQQWNAALPVDHDAVTLHKLTLGYRFNGRPLFALEQLFACHNALRWVQHCLPCTHTMHTCAPHSNIPLCTPVTWQIPNLSTVCLHAVLACQCHLCCIRCGKVWRQR